MNEIYELMRTAGTREQPVAAVYEGALDCFVRTCWAGVKQGRQNAFCYQFGGASSRGLRTVSAGVGWRCIVVEKLSQVELLFWGWHTELRSNRQTCVEEVEFDADAQRGDDPQ